MDNDLKSCGISPGMLALDNVAQNIVQRNLCRPKVYNCLKQITSLQDYLFKLKHQMKCKDMLHKYLNRRKKKH